MTDINFDDQEAMKVAETWKATLQIDAHARYGANKIIQLSKENLAEFEKAGEDLMKYLNEKQHPVWCTMMVLANVLAQEICTPIEGVHADKITHAERMASFMHLLTACIHELEKEGFTSDKKVN